MTPSRSETINGRKVEEFYWAGDHVVYIDNHLMHWTFEAACEYAKCLPAPPADVKGE